MAATVDPARIVDALTAYWQTSTLTAAIQLELFTALGTNAHTIQDLAARCGADPARLRRLCDALVAQGFLRGSAGRYRAAAGAARYLDRRSPQSLAGLTRFFNAPPVTSGFATLAGGIRHGPSVRAGARRAPWRAFAEALAPLRREVARVIARELQARGLVGNRILDVGAGASPLGIELLRRHRSATLVVQDRLAMVRLAREHAAAAGVASRVTSIAGDAETAALGGPYDLVLMVNVLDYIEPRARTRLLRRTRAALAPGGVLAVCAPLLDRAHTSPPEAVAYDLLLLALGAPGGASTYEALREALRRAGLGAVTRCTGASLVLARRPARPVRARPARR